jgi:hypothetical protein
MTLRVDNRSHPRLHVEWPVVVVSSEGSREAVTENISLDGAFIRFRERPDLGDNFKMIIKPSGEKYIAVTAVKVWSANFNINGKITFSAMGVRFSSISDTDRAYISLVLSDYLEPEQNDPSGGH